MLTIANTILPLGAMAMLLAIDPAWLCLIVGCVLCLMELFVPTAFVEMAMGISAILVAAIAAFVPYFGLQVLLWMVFSLLAILTVRRWINKPRPKTLEDPLEAETLTEIAPGQAGRVMFEGNSWRAKSEGDRVISPQETVLVVGRKGNTLIVIPENLLES